MTYDDPALRGMAAGGSLDSVHSSIPPAYQSSTGRPTRYTTVEVVQVAYHLRVFILLLLYECHGCAKVARSAASGTDTTNTRCRYSLSTGTINITDVIGSKQVRET